MDTLERWDTVQSKPKENFVAIGNTSRELSQGPELTAQRGSVLTSAIDGESTVQLSPFSHAPRDP